MVAECTATTETMPCIPLDVFGIIAEWLVAQDLQATCAALNATSKHVQDETTRTLWRRVVYRFNNGPSNKKKAGIRWRTTFGSVAAQYIQYLIVIPSILPEVGNDIAPWEAPFIELITSRRNKLKACVLPGKPAMVSVTLFPGYQPCSTDLCQVMACGELLRRITDRNVPCALVRLYKQDRTADERDIVDQELETAFTSHHKNIRSLSVEPVPFMDIRLFLTPQETLSTDFVTRLSVDILSWQSLAVYICCDGNLGREQQKKVAESLHLGVYVALFDQALAFGRALRIAYDVDTRFACLRVRVSTRVPINQDQVRHFLRTIEQSLLRTSPFFVDKPSGGVLLQDRSKESAKRNGGPGMKPPFASLGYSIVRRDSGPTVEAYRRIGLGGESPVIKERIYLERGCRDADPVDRKMEEVLKRLSLLT